MKLGRLIITSFLAAALSLTFGINSYAQQSHEVILAGYNHSPTVPTSGSGMATVTFKKDTLKIKGDFENLVSTYRGAYIMIGEEGKAGNMLFRLKVELNEERTGGFIKPEDNTFVLDNVQKPLLKNGELFINITSHRHTTGELRGQIPPMDIN